METWQFAQLCGYFNMILAAIYHNKSNKLFLMHLIIAGILFIFSLIILVLIK